MSAGEAATLLKIEGLSKTFGGFRAVRELNLVVSRGEIVALIGPNGAGKSTLLNMASGLLQPTHGLVFYNGRDVTHAAPNERVRLGIARSFQITSIFGGLTVADNVRIAAMAKRGLCWRFLGFARRLLDQEVHDLLAQVRLIDRTDSIAGELAAGDRKRLEFAIALASQPDLLLLDEPTAGMSLSERALVSDLIRDINDRIGVTVLFTEHDIDMVFALANRVAVMHQGEKLTEGLPAEVRNDRRVRQLYLGEEPHVEV